MFSSVKELNIEDSDMLRKGICPKCRNNRGFFLGPRGGEARNIKCDECGEEFNLLPAPFACQECWDELRKAVEG